jgi:hypothetical protein
MPRRPRLAPLSTRAADDVVDDHRVVVVDVNWDAVAPSGDGASRRDALAEATHRGAVDADDAPRVARVRATAESRRRPRRVIVTTVGIRFFAFSRPARFAKKEKEMIFDVINAGLELLAKVGDDELFEGFHALDHGRGHHRGGVAAKVFFTGALVKVVDDEVDDLEQIRGLTP